MEEAVEKIGPWIGWTTVADYVRHPRFKHDLQLVNYTRQTMDLIRAVPAGRGIVDYAAFFRGLKSTGFSGHVAYEMCAVLDGGGSMENLDRTGRIFLEFLADMES
jgi:sugar phosphate isomerase/epimerase